MGLGHLRSSCKGDQSGRVFGEDDGPERDRKMFGCLQERLDGPVRRSFVSFAGVRKGETRLPVVYDSRRDG